MGAFLIGIASSLVANLLGLIDIGSIIKTIASSVHYIMVINIPLWVILSAALIILAVISVHLSIVISLKKKRKKKIAADWRKITSIEYGGHFFKWEYLPNGMPSNIREVCHICDCELGVSGCVCGSKRRPLPRAHAFIADLQSIIISNAGHNE